jgi:hypothetical protein
MEEQEEEEQVEEEQVEEEQVKEEQVKEEEQTEEEEQAALPFGSTWFDDSESESSGCWADGAVEELGTEDRVLFGELALYTGSTLEAVCAMKEEERDELFRALGMRREKSVRESCTKKIFKQLDDRNLPATPPRHRSPARRHRPAAGLSLLQAC